LPFRPPWSLCAEILTQNGFRRGPNAEKNIVSPQKNLQSFPWWRCRELNPGPEQIHLTIFHKISRFKGFDDKNRRDIIKVDLQVLGSSVQIKPKSSSL